MSNATARRETIGLRSDKEQIEEGFLSLNRAGKRGGNGSRFLERFTMGVPGEGVQHQGVADKEFIFEFFDHRLARAGPTAPMDVAKRITLPIISEGNKFVALANVRG